jgi:hypothetical protein
MRRRALPWLAELFLEALIWALADGVVAGIAWCIKRWRKARRKRARKIEE